MQKLRMKKYISGLFLGIILAVLYWWNISLRQVFILPEDNTVRSATTFYNTTKEGATTNIILKDEKDTNPLQLIEEIPITTMLPAIQVFKTYQKEHSNEALLREYTHNETDFLSERKFSVAYYWCPERLGNIFHSFFNAIVWSIIHNRTILWKYHDGSNVGTEAECQKILRRAPWLPSYDLWKERLDFDDDEAVPVSLNDKNMNSSLHPKLVLYPQISDVLVENKKIRRTGWSEDPSQSIFKRYRQKLPKEFQKIAQALYSEGKGFLYGMLYYEIFSLQIPVEQNVFKPMGFTSQENNVFSVALHSRHTVGADDGSFVLHEVKCLEKFLSVANYSNCQVHIMSDRRKTIDSLIEWLLQRNCSAVIANHDDGPRIHDIPEHGPWTGAGFVQDMEVTSGAKHGFVGDRERSSTFLIIYAMEYRRRMHLLETSNSLDKLPGLKICDLPRKPLSGYDYGPGTPTFRHHSYLKPLEPVGVMNVYKQLYQDFLLDLSKASESQQSLQQLMGEHNFLVSFFDYTSPPTLETVYRILNSFLYSIISNRTFLLLEGDCGNASDKDKNIFDSKAWLATDIVSATRPYICNNTRTKFHFDGPHTSSWEESLSIIEPDFENQHYNLSHWRERIHSKSQGLQVEHLFARGNTFLYGFLFHEIFDIKERINPPWNVPPTTSILLDKDVSNFSIKSIEKCLEPFVEEKSFTSNKADCHIFVISEAKQSSDRNIDVNNNCSYSFIELTSHSAPDGSWWRNIDIASHTRTGWIAPFHSTMPQATTTFMKERIEYYRYRETWKLGRDPFYISELKECYY